MVEKTVLVTAASGLHARPASQLVNYVKNYNGDVTLVSGEKTANMKSILNVMALGIGTGMEVTVRVEGEDEENFATELVEFIKSLKD